MIIEKQELTRFRDAKVMQPVYAHQKYILNYDLNDPIKIHVPTSGGKTLCAIFFALREKYENQIKLIKTILTYPTNLLSKNQFEKSIVDGLTKWVGAREIIRGIIHPVEKTIKPSKWNDFFEVCGAPTVVFELPAKLGKSKLLVSILTGEILFNMFNEENKLELGERKGRYLMNILEKIMNYDHIIITSPDLLGYVAQQCYSVSTGWYNQRWKDELSVKFWEHDVVVDEYHFYDPYTYINLENTIKRLNLQKILLLSATERTSYFGNAKTISFRTIEEEFLKDKVDTIIASYPIEVNLIEDRIKIDNKHPSWKTIYFFNSVITAHEVANELREKNIRLTEWTGIEKSKDELNNIIIATSAAEVGLDLPLQEVHTEFWGHDWEVPSLIQRLGRVGRFESKYPFKAFIYIEGAEQPYIIKKAFNAEYITKDKLTEILSKAYPVYEFNPKDYVSYYLWDEELIEELKRKWEIINEKINFYFRPPQTQAVFIWNDHKFVYNKSVIENKYNIELVRNVTDMPFWRTFGLSEYKIISIKEKRDWKKPYDGKLNPPYRSKKWFIPIKQSDNII